MPSYFNFELDIDGQPARLDPHSLRRRLNPRNRKLTLEAVLYNRSGVRVAVTVNMFLHFGHPDLAVMNVTIKVPGNHQLTFYSGLDDNLTADQHQLLSDQMPQIDYSTGEHCLTYIHQTKSHRAYAISQRLDLYDSSGELLEQDPEPIGSDDHRQIVGQKLSVQARAGQTYHLLSVSSIQVADDDHGADLYGPWAEPAMASQIAVSQAQTYQELLTEHNAAWDQQWQQANLPNFRGSPDERTLLRHSQSIVIGTAGTHNGYESTNHNLWASHTIIPKCLSLKQQRAQLDWRFNQLQTAQRIAQQLGYQGACWGWQATYPGPDKSSSDQVFNARAHPDTAETLKTSVHLSADIVNAVIDYYRQTGDYDWLQQQGAELVTAATRFLISRASLDETSQTYYYQDVRGPHEHAEPVSQEAYTQFMTAHAVRFALELAQAKPALIDLNAKELAQWQKFSHQLALPFDPETLEIPPYASGQSLRHMSSVNHLLVLLDQQFIDLIEDRYGETTIHNLMHQHHCRSRGELMRAIYRTNAKLNQLTTHSTAVSPLISLITDLAGSTPSNTSRIETIHQAYRQALSMGFGSDLNSAANIAAAVWAISRGFMGIRAVSGSLHIDPCLPAAWPELSCLAHCYGSPISVTANHTGITTVELLGSNPAVVSLTIQGVEVELGLHSRLASVQNGRLLKNNIT